MKNRRKPEYSRGTALPLGVVKFPGEIQFSVAIPNEESCLLKLYSQNEEKPVYVIEMTKEFRIGSVFSVRMKDNGIQFDSYQYEVNGKLLMDPYAKGFLGTQEWGKLLPKEEHESIKVAIIYEDFEWEGDRALKIPYHELLLYHLHVRGFTRHPSSKVMHKGTFLGIQEKIPYFKELGINAIELMPAYEFNEVMRDDPYGYPSKMYGTNETVKLNYWGYTKESFYFAPKASYAANPSNAVFEFKMLVKELHKNGIELIMEFYFAEGTKQHLILDCLRYWSLECHVDGFKINEEAVPLKLLATDPVLSEVKLFSNYWNVNEIYDKNYDPAYKNLAGYNDGYLIDTRRYLRGDEEQVSKFLMRMKANPDRMGTINYITNTNGFTLWDLYSYDIKHNEANGENNHDGTNYNYSWNCGEEGKAKKKKVVTLRRKQVRNALLMLFFSQGTPLLLAGDEFGNSQSGNNNAYCQDNEISWLDWNLQETNEDLFLYVKKLIEIRKAHKILHLEDEMRNMDYISCGFPDMSYHGTDAWRPDFSNYSRVLGIMLCGKYAVINRKTEDAFFYVAYNMHWEKHEFALPKLSGQQKWYVLIDNNEENPFEAKEVTQSYVVNSRTIVVFIGR